MHSSVIGKIEKAHRYARERDRITVERLAVTFAGDNDSHHLSPSRPMAGSATATTSSPGKTCAHIAAMQEILGVMLPEERQTSLFPESEEVAEAAGA